MGKNNLTAVVDLISADQKSIAKKLIDELIFMQGLLKDLKETIKNEGVVDMSKGIPRESPAIRTYNATIKGYGTLLKQLEAMLRKDGAKLDGEDALKTWLEGQK